uniref:Uncharacterized protein n=1 Tax=Strigamia maritima TaxID=126957 RepID=T1JII6_STRMM
MQRTTGFLFFQLIWFRLI